MSPWLILLVPLLIVALLVYRHMAKRKRRAALLATPLTPQQRHIVEQLVPLVTRLPNTLRAAHEGKINLFLDQVTFRGKNGVEVTEAMRLSIAAQACLLIVNSPQWYDTIRNVLLYPAVFDTGRGRHDGTLVHEHRHGTLGESWQRGPVVLSWNDALHGGLRADDGENVVIHEFAHQLDSLTGHTNGIPILRKGQAYAKWEQAMLDAYHAHVAKVEAGEPALIDPYGATNHEEFFAEGIVTFFEKPQALKAHEPALYAEFSKLLALNPAEWN
ncbi:zinc-dependent peptidase [Erythrobacter sp. SCSIO 43205]|uniref:M90 family metallopeptidase n=1 Tax=Erythrobacter sp. SCSIO 43205 TaxID=2779361 RepID=UPI001CA86E58|nr:M90 family metallopeptidase [Erythrobacter sp. SCSIO 43205]UAB79077.1 zinc-dependent peptidase [Erythrobacter sp. SCSIO 43205]